MFFPLFNIVSYTFKIEIIFTFKGLLKSFFDKIST